jgi:phospholipase/carboxylesterase
MTDAPDDLLPCVELGPDDATRSVVWLHGLGADGHDFAPIVPHLGLDDLGVRFVFPHAPSIPISINGGFVMPAWYDIAEIDLQRKHDMDGVRRSATSIHALLDRERDRGVADVLADERDPASAQVPDFQGHGTADPMVPMARGQAAHVALAAMDQPARWETYAMQHEVCLVEMQDAGAWLRERLA